MKLFDNIKSLRDREKGRRAFIMANGPSLLNHELSRCKNDVIIGMNATSILQDEFDFKMDYYCVSDRRFLLDIEKKKHAQDFVSGETICVFREELRGMIEKDKLYYTRSIGRDGFSFNLNNGFFFGSTTVLLAMQLAAYIGCNKIYLLGVDMQYKSESPRFYKEEVPQIEDSTIGIQIHNYLNARKALSLKGIELFSCSQYSLARPYIPYVCFDSLFSDY